MGSARIHISTPIRVITIEAKAETKVEWYKLVEFPDLEILVWNFDPVTLAILTSS